MGFYSLKNHLPTKSVPFPQTLFGEALVHDQSGKVATQITNIVTRAKTIAPTVVQVHKVFAGNPPVAAPNPDSIQTFNTVVTPDETQLKIESTSNVGDQITAYLNSKEIKNEMIDKRTRPLEKKHLRTYLNAVQMTYMKENDEISYHFSIQIKNEKADYELFFDVNKEE